MRNNTPLAGANISIYDDNPNPADFRLTDENGIFQERFRFG
jgi:hypothetical protein